MKHKKRSIPSVRVDISRLNSEITKAIIAGGFEGAGRWVYAWTQTLAEAETETPEPWALELLAGARNASELRAAAGSVGGKTRWCGVVESKPEAVDTSKNPMTSNIANHSNAIENHSNAIEKHSNAIEKHSNAIEKHSNAMSSDLCSSPTYSNAIEKHSNAIEKHSNAIAMLSDGKAVLKREEIKREEIKTERERKTERQISKDIWQAKNLARPENQNLKPTNAPGFSLPLGGDLVPKKFLDELLALGNFQAVRYDAKNPSATLRKISACLRQIQAGSFLREHKWDRKWLGGRCAGLEDIPGLPMARGTEKYSEKISDDSILHLFRVALQSLADFQARGKVWPTGGGKIPLGEFLLNERDVNACTSPLIGFAYSRTLSATAGLEDKIAELPIGVQKAASALLRWHRTEGQEPLEGRALANFWASITRLVWWHDRNAPILAETQRNKVLPGWAEDVSTPARFVRLVGRAFQAGIVSQFPALPPDGSLLDCPETEEADVGGGGHRWKRFISWVEINTDASIQRSASPAGLRQFSETLSARILRREGIPLDYLADFNETYTRAQEEWEKKSLLGAEHPWARHNGGPPEGREPPQHPLEISRDDVRELAEWEALQSVRGVIAANDGIIPR